MSQPSAPDTTRKLLVLEGELSVSNAAALRRRLLDALQGPLDVDLSAVTHIDCAGLQLLIMLSREARARSIPLTLHSPSRAVHSAFALVRLPGEFSAPPGCPA